MKYTALALPLLFLLAGITIKTAHAETSVSIANNGSGSNSSVVVNNSTSTSSNQQSSSTSQTHIRMETNGKVQTYDSNKPENINMQSDDGTSQVHINNSVNGATTTTSTIDGTNDIKAEPTDEQKEQEQVTPDKVNKENAKNEEHKKALEEQHNAFITFLNAQFTILKKLLSLHF